MALGNKFGLTCRDGENTTAFVARLMRAEFMEEAARIVEGETVGVAGGTDATDEAYNLALRHAAAAIRLNIQA